MHPLQTKFSTPLEREYEAWIMQGIEDYFASFGEKVAVWAVSPNEEVSWPADQNMIIGKKLIGLQLKKVDLKISSGDELKFGRLNWRFHSPTGQYELIEKFPEIFYCLPTFINRDLKKHALHHCLFWRPTQEVNKNAWFDNENASTPYNSIARSARWGFFLESIMDCTVGKKVSNFSDAENYVKAVRDAMKGELPEKDEPEVEQFTTLSDPVQVSTVNSILLMAIPINK